MELGIDHVTTYTDADDVREYLERYARAGFAVTERVVKHAHGVESGRIHFGGAYLEFLAVTDGDAFNRAPNNDKLMYRDTRPFGLALSSRDVRRLRDAWIAAGAEVPELTTLRAHDQHATAIEWRILTIPLKTLRGASCFVIEHGSPATEPPPSPNGTFALAGVTLVSTDAHARAAQWSALLAPGEAPPDDAELFTVSLGAQRACWLTPGAYREHFGWTWQEARHPLGELGAVHLMSDDLEQTRGWLRQGERRWREDARGTALVVEPDPSDGFTLVIHACARDVWEDATRRGAIELLPRVVGASDAPA